MKFRAGMIIIAALLAQACTIPLRELRHSGGYPGQLMDRRLFDASNSKQLQLLRLTMIVALASRVGNATIQDGKEADAFISYLQNASSEINYLAAHLYDRDETGDNEWNICSELAPSVRGADWPEDADQNCDTYAALFESDLPQLEYKVARLVLAALPREHAAQFARSARSGNLASAAWHFLRLAAASIDGLHRGAAVYRSSQEVLALTILSEAQAPEGPACAPGPSGTITSIRTVENAVDCLGLSRTSLFDNPNEGLVRFPDRIGQAPFRVLYGIIRTSCGLLPIDIEIASAIPTTGTNNVAAGKIRARYEACRELTFSPRLRFGGWAAPEDAVQPQPAAADEPATRDDE
ncbi:MAG: hypothetical protein KF780_07610 [Sphingomonas sp.]|nr:hypothetical protein [Sphingomonas sp.]